jgi:hypothetical protein
VVADPRGTAAPKSATGWPASSRNGGRHQIGMVADIVSEQVAGMRRNPHADDYPRAVLFMLLAAVFLPLLTQLEVRQEKLVMPSG